MTAIELKLSIMSDLNAMSVELLEVVARYVRELNRPAEPAQAPQPRKLRISDSINKLRGQFVIPANVDAKEMIASHLMEKHVAR